MPEFLRLLPPEDALRSLLSSLAPNEPASELLPTESCLDRVCAEDILAPHPLPEFERSTVDGYAVQAADTHGATDSLPAYLVLRGEVPMGRAPFFQISPGHCALIHTGGMIPAGANAVVMLEHAQVSRTVAAIPSAPEAVGEIEVLRPVAPGENVIGVGEDVKLGQVVIARGTRIGPAHIGGLMALGLTAIPVSLKPRIAIISSGDEVVPPGQRPAPGQVRDVNGFSLAAAIRRWGGEPVFYGIVSDQSALLGQLAARALAESACVIITAGSSASSRDQTAAVIDRLGRPGVLVHGVNTRPGKPTILGVCAGKPVLGLPGNPVSALVNAYLFVRPLLERLLGLPPDQPRASVVAELAVNLPSEAGREDWWPARLQPMSSAFDAVSGVDPRRRWKAQPIFGRSNLIFTLASADGLIRIPAEWNGLGTGALVEVFLL